MSDDNLLPPLPAAPNPERALHDAIVADTRARMADFTAMLSADGITPQRALRLIGVYAETQRSMLRAFAISRDSFDEPDAPGDNTGLVARPLGQRYNAQDEMLAAASAMFDKISGPQQLTALTASLKNATAAGDLELVAKLRARIDVELGLDERGVTSPLAVGDSNRHAGDRNIAEQVLDAVVTSTGVKDAPELAPGWRYATDEEIACDVALCAVREDGRRLQRYAPGVYESPLDGNAEYIEARTVAEATHILENDRAA